MADEIKNGDLHNRSLQIRFRMLKEKWVDISHETWRYYWSDFCLIKFKTDMREEKLFRVSTIKSCPAFQEQGVGFLSALLRLSLSTILNLTDTLALSILSLGSLHLLFQPSDIHERTWEQRTRILWFCKKK